MRGCPLLLLAVADTKCWSVLLTPFLAFSFFFFPSLFFLFCCVNAAGNAAVPAPGCLSISKSSRSLSFSTSFLRKIPN
ncbi:hypothetical protein IWX91DRAFT_350221 [Phyllosticta citricarpa]